MQKTEAKFQTKFNSWLRNYHKMTGAYELKVSKSNKFYFKQLKEHQEAWLLTVSTKTAVYKISDESSGYKPFDCFSLHRAKAYVVVYFTMSNFFYLIPIKEYLKKKEEKLEKGISYLMEIEIRRMSFYFGQITSL